MADKLLFETTPQDDTLVVTASLAEAQYLPEAMFIYANTGETTLGKYIGVCNLAELGRLQEWTGDAIPVFGNAYVRFRQAKIVLPLGDDAALAKVKSNMTNVAESLRTQIMNTAASSSIISIE